MKRASSDLQIKTFSDREILGIIGDVGNGEAEILASELALRIFGLKPDEDEDVRLHATRCVTARLTWMRRYGLIVKGERKGEWAMSEMGRALRFNHLGRSLSSAISNTPEASLMEMTHQVSERMLGAGDVAGRAMRREFQHQVTRRRWR